MKLLLKLLLVMISALAVVAPFTFLKPTNKTIQVNDVELSKKPVVTEKPLHNVQLPNFSQINDIRQKKEAFFNFLKPAIVEANLRLLQQRKKIEAIQEKAGLEESLTDDDIVFLSQLSDKYRIKRNLSLLTRINQLLNRVDVIPAELVLVQAANESAWGTSRFARVGLNFFGIWCYQKGCGMVPKSRTAGLKHEVAAFQSVEQAVQRYLHNINTNNAYHVFRSIRQQLREQAQPLSPEILATGLLPYSERGVDYVSEIIEMLRHNAKYIRVKA